MENEARSESFDGDRESDRLKLRTAEGTSSLWPCVGEGRVKVPPGLLGKDMFVGAAQGCVWNVVVVARRGYRGEPRARRRHGMSRNRS